MPTNGALTNYSPLPQNFAWANVLPWMFNSPSVNATYCEKVLPIINANMFTCDVSQTNNEKENWTNLIDELLRIQEACDLIKAQSMDVNKTPASFGIMSKVSNGIGWFVNSITSLFDRPSQIERLEIVQTQQVIEASDSVSENNNQSNNETQQVTSSSAIEEKDLSNEDDSELHTAIKQGNEGTVRKLFFSQSNGVDINAQNAAGKTPLHLIVEMKDQELALKLVELFLSQAKTDIEDKNGKTAVEYAQNLRIRAKILMREKQITQGCYLEHTKRLEFKGPYSKHVDKNHAANEQQKSPETSNFRKASRPF